MLSCYDCDLGKPQKIGNLTLHVKFFNENEFLFFQEKKSISLGDFNPKKTLSFTRNVYAEWITVFSPLSGKNPQIGQTSCGERNIFSAWFCSPWIQHKRFTLDHVLLPSVKKTPMSRANWSMVCFSPGKEPQDSRCQFFLKPRF